MTEQKTPADMMLSSFFETMKNEGARDLRAAAWAEFSRKGLPNRRVEAWRYTDLRAALRVVAPLADRSVSTTALSPAATAGLLVLDGEFRPEHAFFPKGVEVQSLHKALAEGDADVLAALARKHAGADDAIVALNAALMRDGVVVRIAPCARLDEPIIIVQAASGGDARSSFSRSLVIVGEDAHATIVENYRPLAHGGAQENHALVFSLRAGAKIEHVAHVAPQADDAVRVISLLATLERGASLNSFCLIEGGGLLRRQIFAALVGEQARASFDGVSLLRGRAHADTTIVLNHLAANGKSRERFRTIVDDDAAGVFQGKVHVAPGAQKTDGAMQSKALLLSDGASMHNKPELEIFADDVVCGHGATCGRLDADQLFYLMARGLPRPEAAALLIEGFANEAMDGIADEASKEGFAVAIAAWLANREART